MIALRNAALMAAGITLPVAVWMLSLYAQAVSEGLPVLGLSLQAIMVLSGLQLLLVILMAPWLADRFPLRLCLLGVLMVVLVPLPLAAVATATGAIAIPALIKLTALMSLAAVVYAVVIKGMRALLPVGAVQHVVLSLLQLSIAVALWRFGISWGEFLGLWHN